MELNQEKTILFFPLNSPGHINSLLGLADRLKTRKFKTVFLILGQMIGTSIQDHGHELFTLEEAHVHEDYEIKDDEKSDASEKRATRSKLKKKRFPGVLKWPQILARYQDIFLKDIGEALADSLVIFDSFMVNELIDNHDKYEAALEAIKPDLVIVDAYYTPPCIVNNGNKFPWVRLYSANPMAILGSPLPPLLKPPAMAGCQLLTKAERIKLQKEEPKKWQAMVGEWRRINELLFEAMEKIGGPLSEFLARKGCEPLKPGQQSHDSPHLNLYLYPKELDYDQDDDLFKYEPRWFRCDSLMRKASGDKLEKQPAHRWLETLEKAMKNKKEMVFFSLGSLASGNLKFMQSVIETLRKDKQRLYVISKGVNGDRIQLDTDNMIGANYLPQTFFLERANLAIIHGGNNSVTECCYFGVPMVVLPAFGDQPDNAQRLEDLKLGRRIDLYNFKGDQLLKAIEEVSADKALREKMQMISAAIQQRNDSDKAVAMLVKLLKEGHLSQEFLEDCRNKSFAEIKF